jgi:hypothetical protein
MARDPLLTVRKLLALSQSSHVHEAAAAAARAQALIERYRLQEMIEAEQAAAAEPVDEELLDVARRTRRWRTVLAAALADVNGCLVFTREVGRERQIVLVGTSGDRAAVRSLWEWLVPQLEWLSATHGPGRDKRWHDDFRVGAAEVIGARLRRVQGDERALAEPEALVRVEPALVARRAAVERWAEERLTTKPGRRLSVGVDAWAAGRAAAREVPLAD